MHYVAAVLILLLALIKFSADESAQYVLNTNDPNPHASPTQHPDPLLETRYLPPVDTTKILLYEGKVSNSDSLPAEQNLMSDTLG